MEVYIDDMLVKSIKAELHITHLANAFQVLKSYNMKLNPTKCVFEVSAGKFLSFIVNSRGIKANPDKIKVVLDMLPPSNVKDIQRLTGRIDALSHFVSKASDKCQAFLLGSGKGLPMGRTLQGGIHGAQNLPDLSPRSSKPFRGRTPHSLPGRFRLLN